MPTEPIPLPSTHNHQQLQPPTKTTKIKSWQPVNVVILYTSIQLNYDRICGCDGGGGVSGGSDADQVCKINFARTVRLSAFFFIVQYYCSPESPRRDQFRESIFEFIAFVQCSLSLSRILRTS